MAENDGDEKRYGMDANHPNYVISHSTILRRLKILSDAYMSSDRLVRRRLDILLEKYESLKGHLLSFLPADVQRFVTILEEESPEREILILSIDALYIEYMLY